MIFIFLDLKLIGVTKSTIAQKRSVIIHEFERTFGEGTLCSAHELSQVARQMIKAKK